MTNSSTQQLENFIEEILNSLISKKALIPQPDEVRNYLLRYPDILDILLPVHKITHSQFGHQAQLSLEVYLDSEEDEDRYLILCIRQEKYDDNIMKQIKEIRANYKRMLANKIGWLLVTTDFKYPK